MIDIVEVIFILACIGSAVLMFVVIVSTIILGTVRGLKKPKPVIRSYKIENEDDIDKWRPGI